MREAKKVERALIPMVLPQLLGKEKGREYFEELSVLDNLIYRSGSTIKPRSL